MGVVGPQVLPGTGHRAAAEGVGGRRAHRRAELEPHVAAGIADGVNVLTAANEHGKSTCFEALHALFFQPYLDDSTSSGLLTTPRDSLAHWIGSAQAVLYSGVPGSRTQGEHKVFDRSRAPLFFYEGDTFTVKPAGAMTVGVTVMVLAATFVTVRVTVCEPGSSATATARSCSTPPPAST
mgnify:CR=1 FL=1